jgi:hypothetical protein
MESDPPNAREGEGSDMRLAALLLLVLLNALPAHASPFDPRFHLSGFDYEDPNVQPATYLEVGEGYRAVGFVTAFPYFVESHVNPVEYEYTVVLDQLTVANRSWDAQSQYLSVAFDNPGRFRLYEDGKPGCASCTPGTPAQYGTNPPNATSPSSFADGTLAVGGQVRYLYLFFDYASDDGGYYAYVGINEGTLKPYVAPFFAEWQISGALNPDAIRPAGYVHVWSSLMNSVCAPNTDPQRGQIASDRILCSPASKSTWGAIKAFYR